MELSEIIKLKRKFSSVGYCNLLIDKVYDALYKDDPEEMLITEDWYPEDGLEYAEYISQTIRDELEEHKIIFITMVNSSGNDWTFYHTFILFLTSENEIWRMESYGGNPLTRGKGDSLYTTRLVEWPTFQNDIYKLIKMNPGKERIAFWNGLFSGNASFETDFDIDVIGIYPPE